MIRTIAGQFKLYNATVHYPDQPPITITCLESVCYPGLYLRWTSNLDIDFYVSYIYLMPCYSLCLSFVSVVELHVNPNLTSMLLTNKYKMLKQLHCYYTTMLRSHLCQCIKN